MGLSEQNHLKMPEWVVQQQTSCVWVRHQRSESVFWRSCFSREEESSLNKEGETHRLYERTPYFHFAIFRPCSLETQCSEGSKQGRGSQFSWPSWCSFKVQSTGLPEWPLTPSGCCQHWQLSHTQPLLWDWGSRSGVLHSQLTPQPHPGVSWLQEVSRAGPASCTRHLCQSRLQRRDEIWGSLKCGLLWNECQGLGVGERRGQKRGIMCTWC